MKFLLSPTCLILFAFGLLLGSFFNVCIYRIPRLSFWSSSRSRCPSCNSIISFWDNIPVLSYLFLRGKARCCGNTISIQYPIVEILAALTIVAVYWHFPFLKSYSPFLINQTEFIRFIHAFTLTSLLLICSFIDINHKIIPDIISLPMILATPLVVYFHPELDWKSALYGILIGAGSVVLIRQIYFWLRNAEGLGLGDAKLLAAIGGWLGYQAIYPTFYFGSVSGAIFGVSLMIFTKKSNLKFEIPFGPFLSMGAIVYFFEWFDIRTLLFP